MLRIVKRSFSIVMLMVLLGSMQGITAMAVESVEDVEENVRVEEQDKENQGEETVLPEEELIEEVLEEETMPQEVIVSEDDFFPEGIAAVEGANSTITQELEAANQTFQFQLLDLVNIERAKVGAKPLVMDRDLYNAGKIRAKELEIRFDHIRPNGTLCTTVSSKVSGENIAWGQRTPAAVMSAWMNSDGHRENILNPNYRSIGIGYSTKVFWVQLFGYGEADAVTEETANWPAPPSKPAGKQIVYTTHVENEGNQPWKYDGEMSGTTGKAYRLEGIWIDKVEGIEGNVEYRTHVQNIGWQDWKKNGVISGTLGKALRLEAIQIRLTGALASKYDIYYRVHCQNYGWLNWSKNGASSGSEGLSLRLEGIQIKLVPKGGAAPGNLANIKSVYGNGYVSGVLYRTHVQNVGWQPYVINGSMSGTSGRALRLEGINIKLTSDVSGGIQYRTHVQNIGWQGWKANNQMSGTSGQSLRLEAIEIKLTGAIANSHDVYYRVHCQNFGWMGWAKNGASAGSAGYSYRLEGIEIRLVPKGGQAPGSTATPFRKK